MAVKKVNVADVHWHHTSNSRSEDYIIDIESPTHPCSDMLADASKTRPQTKGGLVGALSDGWDTQQGIVRCVELDESEIETAMLQRRDLILDWEKNEKTRPLADAAKLLWGWDDKSKTCNKRPKYSGNSCFRRSIAILGVLAESGRTRFNIYIEPVTYENEADRFLDHVAENTKKQQGAVGYSPIEWVRIARRLVGLGLREADLVRNGVKRGSAQKLFALAELDARFPKLRLIDRCAMPTPDKPAYRDGGFIPLASLRADKLRELARDNPRTGTKAAASGAEVEAYVEQVFNGTTNKTKAMSAESIDRHAKLSDAYIVRTIAKAIATNDVDIIVRLVRNHADKLNEVYTVENWMADTGQPEAKPEPEPAK